MPPTSIFISAASVGTSGIGYSRISVLLGPVRTAASTFSATAYLQIIMPLPNAQMRERSCKSANSLDRYSRSALDLLASADFGSQRGDGAERGLRCVDVG